MSPDPQTPDPLQAINALIEKWRKQSAEQSRARKGLGRNTPANAFKEGVQVASFDCANELAELYQPLRAQAKQIAALTAQLEQDRTNHHNAVTCPYCNPQGLTFQSVDAEARCQALEQQLAVLTRKNETLRNAWQTSEKETP